MNFATALIKFALLLIYWLSYLSISKKIKLIVNIFERIIHCLGSITALLSLILMLPIFRSSCYKFNYSFFNIHFHDPYHQKQNEMVNPYSQPGWLDISQSVLLIRNSKSFSALRHILSGFHHGKICFLILEHFFTNFYKKLGD